MARLRWRTPVAADGRHLADWIGELRGSGASGVYLIRDARTRQIRYIGESHTGRLFETMTRHLYMWNGKGSGPSYRPNLVELAIIVAETPLDDPVADQYELIQQHEPPDNQMDGHTLWWRMTNPRRKANTHDDV